MESSTVAPSCYGCFNTHAPSACPFVAGVHTYNKASLLNAAANNVHNVVPSAFNAHANVMPSAWWPSTFDRTAFERFPSTWWPSTFGGNVASWPSTWWPSTFGANAAQVPSTWWPSTFEHTAAHVPSWFNNFWAEKTWARHMLPAETRDVAFRPASMIEFTTLSNPIRVHPIDGSRMLNLCFDVKGFKPEEVTVSVSLKERCFTVECKHDVKEKEHAVARSYVRKFTIPAEFCCDLTKIDAKEIKSCFTHDGLLVIEAVLPRMTAEEDKLFREKNLTLTHAGRCHTTGLYHGAHACAVPVKIVA